MPDIEDQTAPAAPEALRFRDDGGDIVDAFVDAVRETIADDDAPRLKALTEDLHEADLGALIEALPTEDRPRLVELLGRDFDFAALTEVDDAVRQEILGELGPETVAQGVRELDSDDAVYILEDLAPEAKAEVLEKLSAGERIILQRALDYPEGSAGRRMQSDVIAVPPFWTVGQTIDFMRETEDLPETFYEIFVVDPGHHYLGSLPLDKLLRSQRPVRVSDIMAEERHIVGATDPIEDVARDFQRYNLVSAPVVEEDGRRLVGVITFDDMGDVIEETVEDDLKQLGGVQADEELTDTVPAIVTSRFPWLLVNMLTAFVSALVIRSFSVSIEKMVALAVLMPIVASMGGNAGTQTMTVAVRALATRSLNRGNAWRVIRREATVGVLNGLAFALIVGTVAALWFDIADLGMVVGLAFLAVLTAAALGGILIPLLLDRLGVDPAVSSGPFVTTVTDVVGFSAFLGIATLWFGLQ